MLGQLQWYKFFLIISLVFFLQGCNYEDIKLSQKDLSNPDALVKALKGGINPKRQKMAEDIYQDGLEMSKQKRWGPAFKNFGTSALYYPTAKALIETSKALANSSLSNEKVKGISRLKRIKKHLISAIAVDEIQKELSKDEVAKVKNDIVCIGDFLTSKIKKDNCIYVVTTLNTLNKD